MSQTMASGILNKLNQHARIRTFLLLLFSPPIISVLLDGEDKILTVCL
jgi:hypothetical protein